jgi:hypothetical protein
MSEHVIPVLRSKRAEISGQIVELEQRVGRLRADLANIRASFRVTCFGTALFFLLNGITRTRESPIR